MTMIFLLAAAGGVTRSGVAGCGRTGGVSTAFDDRGDGVRGAFLGGALIGVEPPVKSASGMRLGVLCGAVAQAAKETATDNSRRRKATGMKFSGRKRRCVFIDNPRPKEKRPA